MLKNEEENPTTNQAEDGMWSSSKKITMTENNSKTNHDSIQPKITPTVAIKKLNPEIESQLGDIMKYVMATPGEPTSETEANFQSIIKDNEVTSENLQATRDIIAVYLVDYMKLFYKDALESIQVGVVVASFEREKMERELLKNGIMTEERQIQNQNIIEKIAKGLPMTTPQGDIIFTKDMIISTLTNINEANERIKTLFN